MAAMIDNKLSLEVVNGRTTPTRTGDRALGEPCDILFHHGPLRHIALCAYNTMVIDSLHGFCEIIFQGGSLDV